jgi:hypothetical protein
VSLQAYFYRSPYLVGRGRASIPVDIINPVLPPSVQVSRIRSVSAGVVNPPTNDPFVLGDTRPDATNTGWSTSLLTGGRTQLTPFNGDLVPAANTTYTDLDIFGFVIANSTGSQGAKLYNCNIRGRGTTVIRTHLVNGAGSSGGMLLERCTISPDFSRYYLNGIGPGNVTALRCNIFNVVDGIHATSPNMKIHGCYVHDLALWDGLPIGGPYAPGNGTEHAGDTVHPEWTHNDTCQPLGGAGLEIVGCAMYGYFSMDVGTPNSGIVGLQPDGTRQNVDAYPNRNYSNGIIITPTGSAVTYLVTKNWLQGGEQLFQVRTKGQFDAGTTGEFSFNRCGADQRPFNNNLAGGYGQVIVDVQMGACTKVGNVFFDDAPPDPTKDWDKGDMRPEDLAMQGTKRGIPANLLGQPLVDASTSTAFRYSITKP